MLQPYERLKEIVEGAGITQKDFAQMMGVSVATQRNYEKGTRSPDFEYLTRMHEAGYDVNYILTGKRSGEEPVPDGFMVVPRLAATASMGGGIPADIRHNDVIERVTISIDWIGKNLSAFSNRANLHIITGRGDSMSDTFEDGDTLIVDVGVHEIASEGIYAFNLDDELYIKRLQRHPDGKVAMISDNPRYKTIMLDSRNSLYIIGKIVGKYQLRRL